MAGHFAELKVPLNPNGPIVQNLFPVFSFTLEDLDTEDSRVPFTSDFMHLLNIFGPPSLVVIAEITLDMGLLVASVHFRWVAIIYLLKASKFSLPSSTVSVCDELPLLPLSDWYAYFSVQYSCNL